jgi:hypothetical protein
LCRWKKCLRKPKFFRAGESFCVTKYRKNLQRFLFGKNGKIICVKPILAYNLILCAHGLKGNWVFSNIVNYWWRKTDKNFLMLRKLILLSQLQFKLFSNSAVHPNHCIFLSHLLESVFVALNPCECYLQYLESVLNSYFEGWKCRL